MNLANLIVSLQYNLKISTNTATIFYSIIRMNFILEIHSFAKPMRIKNIIRIILKLHNNLTN